MTVTPTIKKSRSPWRANRADATLLAVGEPPASFQVAELAAATKRSTTPDGRLTLISSLKAFTVHNGRRVDSSAVRGSPPRSCVATARHVSRFGRFEAMPTVIDASPWLSVSEVPPSGHRPPRRCEDFGREPRDAGTGVSQRSATGPLALLGSEAAQIQGIGDFWRVIGLAS